MLCEHLVEAFLRAVGYVIEKVGSLNHQIVQSICVKWSKDV